MLTRNYKECLNSTDVSMTLQQCQAIASKERVYESDRLIALGGSTNKLNCLKKAPQKNNNYTNASYRTPVTSVEKYRNL